MIADAPNEIFVTGRQGETIRMVYSAADNGWQPIETNAPLIIKTTVGDKFAQIDARLEKLERRKVASDIGELCIVAFLCFVIWRISR